MVKIVFSVLGIICTGLAIVLLLQRMHPTSGLMLLSVGLICLIISVVIRYRKPRKNPG